MLSIRSVCFVVLHVLQYGASAVFACRSASQDGGRRGALGVFMGCGIGSHLSIMAHVRLPSCSRNVPAVISILSPSRGRITSGESYFHSHKLSALRFLYLPPVHCSPSRHHPYFIYPTSLLHTYHSNSLNGNKTCACACNDVVLNPIPLKNILMHIS